MSGYKLPQAHQPEPPLKEGVPNVVTLLSEDRVDNALLEAIVTDLDAIFRESIPNLISIVEELNPSEKPKIIGKLKGALELFNQK